MSGDGLPDESRQAVQDLLALLYTNTPLNVVEQRACERAREVLEADCIFFGALKDGHLSVKASACSDAPIADPSALLTAAISSQRRTFNSDGVPGVAVPAFNGKTLVGGLAAFGGRRSRFFDSDADVLECFADTVGLTNGTYADVHRRFNTLRWQHRAPWLVALIALLCCVGLAAYGYVNARSTRERVNVTARNLSSVSRDRVERYGAGGSQLASTAAAIAPSYRGNRPGTEHFLRTFLASSSEIVYGIGVWYEPFKFSKNLRLFGPYAHKTQSGGTVLTYQWSHVDYDYVRHKWYRLGLLARSSTIVTDPYFDIDHIYISAVRDIQANGHSVGVVSVDTTSSEIDRYLASMSNEANVRYLITGSGRVVAFPQSASLLQFAARRHHVKNMLDVTDSDAQAFIASRYPGRRVVTRQVATRVPLILINSFDAKALGSAPPPVRLLGAIAALVCLLAIAGILALLRAAARGSAALTLERERAYLSLKTDITHVDPLTDLANRHAMIEEIDTAITEVRERGARRALLWIDLTGFERINDRFGRSMGDRILREFAALLRRVAPEGAVLGRVGGDEFAVLLDGDASHASAVGERLHHEMAVFFPLDGDNVYVDARIVALDMPDTYTGAQDVIRDASYAVQEAKFTRRNTVVVFDPELRESAARQHELQAELRGAIARGEIFVEYQPICRIRNGEVVGFEALARWRREGQPVMYPTDFIPLGEQTGLVLQLDRHVAEVACDRLAQWQRSDPKLRLQLNASALHFEEPAALRGLTAAVRERSVRPGSVDIELTESALMGLTPEAIDAVRELHAQGMRLHLDDFGTGYSSLAYLQRLHVDALKIDRSFVETMLEDQRSMQIVQAIVKLAQSMKVDLIAEGVTTKDQARALLKLGVTMGQGFYYSPPVAADEAERLITAQAR